MRKSESAAPKVGDDSPVQDRIEDQVLALATAIELPHFAIAACTLRIEEAGPALCAVVARAADGEILSADDATLLFRGLHVLGGARDRRAFQPLLRFLRRPGDEIDALLGDDVTEYLARIVVSVFDDDVDGLFAAIADRSVEPFVRSSLFDAAAFLTWEGRIDRDRMRQFLERFHTEVLAADGDYAWYGWQQAISLLGMRELAPRVSRAWDEGRMPDDVSDPDEFEDDVALAERAPADTARFEDACVGYIEDALDSLIGTRHASAVVDAPRENWDWTERSDHAPQPYVNPLRNVGRNDPCPCGSGKKYKKCCLAA